MSFDEEAGVDFSCRGDWELRGVGGYCIGREGARFSFPSEFVAMSSAPA
jgi:hypothetical protein